MKDEVCVCKHSGYGSKIPRKIECRVGKEIVNFFISQKFTGFFSMKTMQLLGSKQAQSKR